MELNEGDAYQEPYSPYWDCYTNPSGSACQVTPEQELEAFGFAFVGLFSVGLGGIVLTDLAAIPATQVIGGRLLKAGAEELAESQMTGREPDPINVVLDAATGVGDDLYQAGKSGVRVYRVWGTDPNNPDIEGSGPWGRSWTPVDPSSVPNYRQAAGLPSGGESGSYNAGRFVSIGTISDFNGIRARSALALDQQSGGLAEFVIPNPKIQVDLEGVYGVNPPY